MNNENFLLLNVNDPRELNPLINFQCSCCCRICDNLFWFPVNFKSRSYNVCIDCYQLYSLMSDHNNLLSLDDYWFEQRMRYISSMDILSIPEAFANQTCPTGG